MILRACAIAWLVSLILPECALCSSVDVKVMSFNVWSAEDGAAGRERIINTIRQSGADIIGFQEMGSGPLAQIAASMGYFSYDQQLGSEAILSRYRILGPAPNRYGALVELAPGHEAWIFNTHLFHAPYGPYQLNGIAYFGGRIYDPALPASITSVVNDQVAARGSEMQAVLRSATDTGAMASGLPVFVTGDFNEASHLDWTAAAATAGVHSAQVPWPASLAMRAQGFKDSWRDVYPNEVTHPGRTWSPVYPSTYMNRGDNPAVQPRPVLEPQDRIDFVYYAGCGRDADRFQAQRPFRRRHHRGAGNRELSVGPQRGDLDFSAVEFRPYAAHVPRAGPEHHTGARGLWQPRSFDAQCGGATCGRRRSSQRSTRVDVFRQRRLERGCRTVGRRQR